MSNDATMMESLGTFGGWACSKCGFIGRMDEYVPTHIEAKHCAAAAAQVL
jgi:hypothetical protein